MALGKKPYFVLMWFVMGARGVAAGQECNVM